jgi:hypothetical protein
VPARDANDLRRRKRAGEAIERIGHRLVQAVPEIEEGLAAPGRRVLPDELLVLVDLGRTQVRAEEHESRERVGMFPRESDGAASSQGDPDEPDPLVARVAGRSDHVLPEALRVAPVQVVAEVEIGLDQVGVHVPLPGHLEEPLSIEIAEARPSPWEEDNQGRGALLGAARVRRRRDRDEGRHVVGAARKNRNRGQEPREAGVAHHPSAYLRGGVSTGAPDRRAGCARRNRALGSLHPQGGVGIEA